MEIIMWSASMMNPAHPYALITFAILIIGFILSIIAFILMTVFTLKRQLGREAM